MKKLEDCTLCSLHKNCTPVKWRISQNIKSPVLFIGEAPGFTEAQQGYAFVGRAGKLLNQWIEYLQITNYVIFNAVQCIPLTTEGKIRPPTSEEIDTCSIWLRKLIKETNPVTIIALGRSAEKALKQIGINPIFVRHPAWYLRSHDDWKPEMDKLKNKIAKQAKQPMLYNKRTDKIPSDAIYIGRPSPYGNPFTVEKYGRENAIKYFESYAKERLEREPNWLEPLRGKNLVCWCSPLPCHGTILIGLIKMIQQQGV